MKTRNFTSRHNDAPRRQIAPATGKARGFQRRNQPQRDEAGFGERRERSFGDRDRAPRGDRSFGERRERPSFGDRDRAPRGDRRERPSFGDRAPRGRGFGRDEDGRGSRAGGPGVERGSLSNEGSFSARPRTPRFGGEERGDKAPKRGSFWRGDAWAGDKPLPRREPGAFGARMNRADGERPARRFSTNNDERGSFSKERAPWRDDRGRQKGVKRGGPWSDSVYMPTPNVRALDEKPRKKPVVNVKPVAAREEEEILPLDEIELAATETVTESETDTDNREPLTANGSVTDDVAGFVKPFSDDEEGPTERIQKTLARCGVASRRKAELLILEGAVTVNGKPVLELGTKVNPKKDKIKVNGTLIYTEVEPIYLALYKPKGMISALADPEGRRHIGHIVSSIRERVIPIGRLNYNSEGLMLLTNDGDMAEKILKARSLPKVYMVKVKGHPTANDIDFLKRGFFSAEGVVRFSAYGIEQALKNKSWIKLEIIEGSQLDIREMLNRKGLLVDRIVRTAIGSISIKGLEQGEYRFMKKQDFESVLKTVRE